MSKYEKYNTRLSACPYCGEVIPPHGFTADHLLTCEEAPRGGEDEPADDGSQRLSAVGTSGDGPR